MNYLLEKLNQYSARNLSNYTDSITRLKFMLKEWSGSCFIQILDSGSRAKGTAIAIASDVDYLISLKSDCGDNKGGLKYIYNALFTRLNQDYPGARRQNVSIRINLNGLEVDVTPARKYSGNTNYHSLFVSKSDSRKQTNVQQHIKDVSQSGRTNEIKLLKIWRERNGLNFSSIYLEYLLINTILFGRAKEINQLGNNFWHTLNELAKTTDNPLYFKIIDPANSNNILSDLLSPDEKKNIINAAARSVSIAGGSWSNIIW
jgi:hypothetical protein